MTDSLRIERLTNTYLAPRGHPAPERLRSELDELAHHRVGGCCERALSELLDSHDESVWLIDELNVDFLMDVNAAPAEELADFWATQITHSLLKTFSAGPDGTRVIRFVNRAEYLARFLQDLARGTAWDRWYYRQFDSLRNLPVNAAIREALLREPEETEAVVVCLYQISLLNSVASHLTVTDQRLVLQLCSLEESPPTNACFAAVLDAWADYGLQKHTSDLELYALIRSSYPQYRAAEVRSSIAHLNVIARWIQCSQFPIIIAAFRNGGMPAAIRLLPPQEHESLLFLYSLSAAEPMWIEKLRAVSADQLGSGAVKTSSRGELAIRFKSFLGGLFLLLPVLLENQQLMRLSGCSEDKVLRYLLLLACCGMETEDAAHDPALLLAAGMSDAPESIVLQQSQVRSALLLRSEDEISKQDLQYFHNNLARICMSDPTLTAVTNAAALIMRGFARRLPGLDKSSARFLWSNVLAGDSWVTVTPERILVMLSARPLEIVMRMAGFHELTYTLPWMPKTVVQIRFEDR